MTIDIVTGLFVVFFFGFVPVSILLLLIAAFRTIRRTREYLRRPSEEDINDQDHDRLNP